MPELTIVHIGLLTAVALIGVVLGWVFRSARSTREKKSITAGWQAQIDSQQTEHDRLAGQNKSLMQQISQYQASNKDSKMRAKELSDSLKEAFSRRDALQGQLKDIRGNLEVAIKQRDNLKTSVDSNTIRGEASLSAIKDRDLVIAKLQKELADWQARVPPLVERYRARNLEAQELEIELGKANDRIVELEIEAQSEHTRIELLDTGELPDGLDASNESHTETSIRASVPHDQIDERAAESIAEPVDMVFDTEVPAAEDQGNSRHHASNENPFPNMIDDQYAASASEQDDLRQIKGVGPAIEKTLHDLGIYRFNQIAEMSEYDIDRVAQQLKGFRSRIYREDWIGQARTLQYRKNNDDLPA